MTADTTQGLAQCPMPGCGGGAQHVKHSAGRPGTMGYDQWHAVSCRICGITMGASDRRFRSRDEAARAWNRRTQTPAPQEPSDLEIDAVIAEHWPAFATVGIRPLMGLRAAFREGVARWGADPQPPDELSPEFTDTARAALLWVLWHHQGASSPVGQPIRFALGMGQHDRLNEHQLREAKRWEALHPVSPSVWAPGVRPLTPERIAAIWVEHGLDDCDPEGFARAIEAAHGITGATDA